MIIDNYLWLLWLLVIIKWLFVIILLWHVSVVCINVVAVFCLFVIIYDVVCINANIEQFFSQEIFRKLMLLL